LQVLENFIQQPDTPDIRVGHEQGFTPQFSRFPAEGCDAAGAKDNFGGQLKSGNHIAPFLDDFIDVYYKEYIKEIISEY
jgi:hypothetical protein